MLLGRIGICLARLAERGVGVDQRDGQPGRRQLEPGHGGGGEVGRRVALAMEKRSLDGLSFMLAARSVHQGPWLW